jgi:uncharacterized protein YjbJ (UPF0337 family)
MNTQTLQNNWSDVKAKIKARWSKFNDSEIDGFKDNFDKMSAQIQKTYGISKEQAEKEFADFKQSLTSIKDSATTKAAPTVQAVKHPLESTHSSNAMASEGGNVKQNQN